MAVLAGCVEDGSDDSADIQPTLDDLWEARLSQCMECHAPGRSVADGPDMSSQAKFLNSLKAKTAEDYPFWKSIKAGNCDDVPFIDPGNAEGSLMVASLVQSRSDALAAAEGCTTAYNLHDVQQAAWDEDEDAALIDALTTWIAEGARDN